MGIKLQFQLHFTHSAVQFFKIRLLFNFYRLQFAAFRMKGHFFNRFNLIVSIDWCVTRAADLLSRSALVKDLNWILPC